MMVDLGTDPEALAELYSKMRNRTPNPNSASVQNLHNANGLAEGVHA